MLSLGTKKLGAQGGIYIRRERLIDESFRCRDNWNLSDVCLRDYVNPAFRQKVWNARGTCGLQPLYFVKQMGNTGRPL